MRPTDAELQTLYAQYAPVIHRRCRSILGNEEDAHDAVQETFSRVIIHWEKFRGESSQLTWMYRISTNYCLNRIRNRRSRADKRQVHRDEIVSTSFERAGSLWEDEATVRRLLELADDQERAIVIHLFFDDMTREQAARMVGVSVPTLRKRLNIFLNRARKAMESDGFALAAGAVVVLLSLLPLLLSLGGAP